MKNNQGVTLIELLIVIVVLGIISAFAIPAVGTIISNTEKDAILADAIGIENAAKLYCASNTCIATQSLTYDQLDDYVQSFDADYYEETKDGGATIATRNTDGDWFVTLKAKASGQLEWTPDTQIVPSAGSRANVDTQ